MIRQAEASHYNTSNVQTVIDCLVILPTVRWLIHFLLCLMGIVSKSIDYQLWAEFGGIFFILIKVDHIAKLSHLLPRFCFNCPLLLQSISQLLLDSVLVSVAGLLGPESPGNKLKIMIMVKIIVIILILRLMLLIRPGDHFVWYPLSLLEQLTKAGSETRAGSEDD